MNSTNKELVIESLQKCIEIATINFGDEFYLSQAYETLGKAFAGNHNYKDAINKILNIEKELFNGRINFFNSLNDILSSQQIAKLLIFEKKFRSEIRRQILKHGKGRMGRNQKLN